MDLFLSTPLNVDILSVPGIGHRNARVLRELSDNYDLKPIVNSYELLGKFLSFKGEGVGPIDHCQKFFEFLISKGVLHNPDDIVRAMAEKANTFIPGIYLGKQIGTVRLFMLSCLFVQVLFLIRHT